MAFAPLRITRQRRTVCGDSVLVQRRYPARPSPSCASASEIFRSSRASRISLHRAWVSLQRNSSSALTITSSSVTSSTGRPALASCLLSPLLHLLDLVFGDEEAGQLLDELPEFVGHFLVPELSFPELGRESKTGPENGPRDRRGVTLLNAIIIIHRCQVQYCKWKLARRRPFKKRQARMVSTAGAFEAGARRAHSRRLRSFLALSARTGLIGKVGKGSRLMGWTAPRWHQACQDGRCHQPI